MKEVLRFLNPTGVRIVALTFGGHPANLGMCAYLGAKLYKDNLVFQHPVDGKNVFIILDICHCAKLIRNTLAKKYVLYNDMNRLIKWE